MGPKLGQPVIKEGGNGVVVELANNDCSSAPGTARDTPIPHHNCLSLQVLSSAAHVVKTEKQESEGKIQQQQQSTTRL